MQILKSSVIGYRELICIDAFDLLAEPKTSFKWNFTMKLGLSSQYKRGDQYKNYKVQTYAVKFHKNDLENTKSCCLRIVQLSIRWRY